jgi:hypothetical protein
VPYEKGKRTGGGWNLMKRTDLFILSIMTATGLPWQLLLMLSVIPTAIVWRLRPIDHHVVFNEVEAASILLFAVLVFSVLRYLRAIMASPPVVSEHC